MTLHHTHTYVILPISQRAFDEIAEKLRKAKYEHAFQNEKGGFVIDMHGIALQAEPESAPAPAPAKVE
jgi:hypothetical protein